MNDLEFEKALQAGRVPPVTFLPYVPPSENQSLFKFEVLKPRDLENTSERDRAQNQRMEAEAKFAALLNDFFNGFNRQSEAYTVNLPAGAQVATPRRFWVTDSEPACDLVRYFSCSFNHRLHSIDWDYYLQND